jgi:hypothetical protein
MTQYLLSVHHDWDTDVYVDQEEMQKAFRQVEAFNQEVQEAGAWVFAGGLTEPATATVVDATAAKTVTTDGPYLETKEHLGGFWVIEAADLDAALEWAAKGSAACMGPVEVRPFQGEPEA